MKKTTLGVVLSVFLSACGSARHALVVDRMDVAVAVLADGTATVEERLSAQFGDTPVSQFRRRSPVWRHDGISDISASMDGVPFAVGEGAGRIAVGNGPALDVAWSFAPASRSTHQFVLTYRARNVIGISGIRGTVSWLALPGRRDFDVSAAAIAVTLPAETILLQDPWTEEPGWQVVRQPNGMTATRSGLAPTESATAGVEFTIDHLSPSVPQWQSDAEFAGEFIPAFVSAALFILVIGAGVLVMLRFKHPRWPATVAGGAGSDDLAAESSVTPAMRIAVMRGRSRGDRTEIMAALQGLVARHVVSIDGDVARVVDPAAALTAHERVITDEIGRRPNHAAPIGEGLGRAARGAFRLALVTDLVAAGLADPERVTAARDLRRAGVAVIVFGFAVWATVAATIVQFGAWPLTVPWSILVVGAVFIAAAARFELISEPGARARMLYFARVRDGRTSV